MMGQMSLDATDMRTYKIDEKSQSQERLSQT